MLGKLIRYDSKIQLRFLCGMYMAAVLISVLSGIFLGIKKQFPDVMIFQIMSGFTWGVCVLAILAVLFGTVIYIIAYFRRNLLRDEGYLMHTLPVTPLQLYGSKLLTGTVCVYLSVLVGYLCFGIGNLRFRYSILEEILKDEVDRTTFWLLGITLFVVVPLMLCQFFFSMALGYTWKMRSANSINRDILSVVVYIITYMIQQVAAVILLLVYLIIRFGSPFTSEFIERVTEMGNQQAEIQGYVQGILWGSLILSVAFGIVLFALSVARLNHHLNLE